YIYAGTKTNTGSEVDKAGLNNGKLFGVSVTGMALESSATVPAAGTRFSLFDLGSVQNTTGAALDAASVAGGVTAFLRPEDGAWDPTNLRDFYFATTNSFTAPSRLWRLRFDDIANPETGGTIEAVLDGTEGQKMLDNIGFDQYGHLILLEDVGNQSHLGKVWQYTVSTDELKQTGTHDSTRFITGGSKFLTQDEESSGVIDVQNILGAGWFLLADQAHYNTGIPDSIVEGGQFLAMYNPDTYNASLNVLPIQSISFTARLSNGKSYLQWKSVNELNVQHYEVERSTDGRQFTKIAIVNGKGSTVYNTIDDLPVEGNNFYRLKIVDKDGKFTYSIILLIKVSKNTTFEFVMYPNPVRDILIIAPSGTTSPVKVTIYNQQGQRVLANQIVGTTGIPIGHLSKGIYVVRLISNGVNKVSKLIRE
ncbi:MAG: T9SS type A sorting domain-containing protein, partial [Ginsengibacter sp.]